MSNCIVAQSGGPSSVINATLAGIVKSNQLHPIYDHVYGGLNGIEGILQERFIDLTKISADEIDRLRQTPSSALGSCRYKLRRENEDDFEKVISIMEKHDIETLFYIGGNDSMDTVAALAQYAERNGIQNRRFVGAPKTIDNDLMFVDHSPGFGSSAKFIVNTTLQCWYDLNVYPKTRKEVFIIETMGRDAGWLAASSCLSGKVDILIVPEDYFDKEVFLKRVEDTLEEKSKCLVVVSEGAHYADGTYVSEREARSDFFSSTVLGGAGIALQQMILDARIADRCKVQDLSIAQRCHATEQSLVDVNESYQLGISAHMHSSDPSFTGKMVGMKRKHSDQYEVEIITVDADQVANYVNNFPREWLLEDYKGITEEGYRYLRPLIQGSPEIIYDENGLPAYVIPYYMR